MDITQEKINRDIENYIEEYLKSPFLKENNWYRRKAVLKEMHKHPHRRILEIGCGMFPLIEHIDGSEYDDYTIVEPSKTFAENAKDISKKKGFDKVKVINDFFENLNISDKYDYIICSSLLHEVRKPELLLSKIRDVCDDGKSVVHINVPNAKSIHRLIAYYGGGIEDIHKLSDRNQQLQQNNVYDLDSLCDFVEANGFEVVEKGSFFVKPFTHSQMQRMVDVGIVNEMVMEGLWGLTKELPEYGSEIYVNICKSCN